MNWPEAVAIVGLCAVFVGGMLAVLRLTQRASPPCPMCDDWRDDDAVESAEFMGDASDDDWMDDPDWWRRDRNGTAGD